MGDVIDLAERRDRRRAAVQDAAERATTALRWAAITDPGLAHKRITEPLAGQPRGLTSRAACGAADALVLAAVDARPCPACYP